MADVFDYIDWRGDLSFAASPANEVDKYIIACIGKPDLTGIIPEGSESIELCDAVAAFFAANPNIGDRMGLISSVKTIPALKKLMNTERFGHLRLAGFVRKLDTERTEQFSALTVIAPDGTSYVSFRGTDDSIVGWKENCEFAVRSGVPAQLDALGYLKWAAESFPGPICVCGHSKGGNLAVYAASFAPPEVQDRISEVISFDGPGFMEDVLGSEGYLRIKDRITTIVPSRSLVGMLMSPAGELRVVGSAKGGVAGHDGFNWETQPLGFVRCDEVCEGSRIFRTAIAETLDDMDISERSELVSQIFDVISCTGAVSLSDFTEQTLNKGFELAKSFTRAGEIHAFALRLLRNARLSIRNNDKNA